MKGKLPCDYCPYGEICEHCPELKARLEGQKVNEKGGFFSQEIREVKGPDGKKKYTYSHPE